MAQTAKEITVWVGEPRIEKRYSTETVQIFSREYISIEDSLDKVIEELIKLRNTYKDKYKDLRIDSDNDCGCYHECRCAPSYYLKGVRLETQIEADFRQARDEKQKTDRENREKEEFERLRKKYQ